jgi:hypothetical protein
MMKTSVRLRILKFMTSRVGTIVTSNELKTVAGDNICDWRRPVSTLRHVYGYRISSHHDRSDLSKGEYVLEDDTPRLETPMWRKRPTRVAQAQIRVACKDQCGVCGISEGARDPVTRRTVKLEFDHVTPFESNVVTNPRNVSEWQLLCPRHNNEKRSFWDDKGGRPNVMKLVQHMTTKDEKLQILAFLKTWDRCSESSEEKNNESGSSST